MAWAGEYTLQREIVSYNIENTLVSLDYFPLQKSEIEKSATTLLVRLESQT